MSKVVHFQALIGPQAEFPVAFLYEVVRRGFFQLLVDSGLPLARSLNLCIEREVEAMCHFFVSPPTA